MGYLKRICRGNKTVRKVLVMIVFFLLFLSMSKLHAAGFSGKDYYTWYGTTADNVTVGWDAPAGYQTSDSFEVQIKNPERNIVVNIPGTTELTKVFKCPKTGHWTVHVRTKRIVNNQPQFSSWADSTDPSAATVDSQPRGWWLFTWLAGTGSINIGSVKEETDKQTGNHINISLSFNSLEEFDNYFASIYGGH
jgi:hypothetical protein